MPFNVGQRVRFLHEKQEGVITRLLGKGRVEVSVDDFLELEAMENELVPIDAGEEVIRSGGQRTAERKAAPEPDAPPALAVIRTEEGDYSCWMLNPGPNPLLFTLYLRYRGKYKGLNGTVIAPREKAMVARISPDEFAHGQSLLVQRLPFQKGDPVRPGEMGLLEVSLKTEVGSTRSIPIPELRAQGWLFPLEYRSQVQEPVVQEPKDSPVLGARHFLRPPREVDLHIEALIDDTTGMQAAAMLLIQLEAFDKAVTDAVMDGVGTLILIHGVGEGVLRKEIHTRLKGYPEVRHFGYADALKYGNGATQVDFY